MALNDLLSDYSLQKIDVFNDITEATLASNYQLLFGDPATNTLYFKDITDFGSYLKTNELVYTNASMSSVVTAVNVDPGVTNGNLLSLRAAYYIAQTIRDTANTFSRKQTIYDIAISNQLSKNFLQTDASGNIVQAALKNGYSIIGSASNLPIEYDALSMAAFDATVGVGGDYATLTAAIAIFGANKRFRVVGNVTEIGDITDNVYIYLNSGVILNMATYNFQGNVTIEGYGSITFAFGTAKALFAGESVVVRGFNDFRTSNALTIYNNSTIAGAYLSKYGIYENVKINLSNYSNCGFGNRVHARNVWLVGGGDNCERAIYDASNNKFASFINIYITGTFKANSEIIYHLSGNFDNIWYNSTISVIFLVSQMNKLIDTGYYVTIDQVTTEKTQIKNSIFGTLKGNRTVNIDSCFINAAVTLNDSYIVGKSIITKCTFNNTLTISANTNYNVLKDNIYNGNVTINSDGNDITGQFATTKSITLASGAENNFIDVRTDTAVTNNSGNSTNTILTKTL